ncbi:MAG: RNA polymerase sigma factor [Actinomycetota bacterium]
MEVTEQVAVERVRAGDRDAYAVLVRLHAAAAHRAAVLFGAGDDAEDIVQAAFVKAFEALHRFSDGAPFRPWLLRIVRNETRNALRADGRRHAAAQRLAGLAASGSTLDPEAGALSAERRTALLEAVRELPEQQRRVIACRFLLDLDEKETATVLGWPVGTVKSRLHRALRRLHERLAPESEEADDEL